MTLSQLKTSPDGENDRPRPEEISSQYDIMGEPDANRQSGRGLIWLALALLLAGLFYGGFFNRLSSFLAEPVQAYLLDAGVNLQKIQIKGQVNLDNAQIVKALGINSGQSLFGFDAIKAQQQLSQLGQVKSARVMRLLPSTLLVEIIERVPFARWLHNGRMQLIDVEGVVLRQLLEGQEVDFPLVVGDGASEKAAYLIRILSTHHELSGRIKMAERVAQYRWNLHAKSGAMIKLPPVDLALGLARLVQLPDWVRLLQQENLVIDLRRAGQAFVRRGKTGRARFVSSL